MSINVRSGKGDGGSVAIPTVGAGLPSGDAKFLLDLFHCSAHGVKISDTNDTTATGALDEDNLDSRVPWFLHNRLE
jgi:hypothetical protein